MGTFRSLIVLAAGAAIGGAALLAYRISRETGKPLQEAFTDIPCEARRLFSEVPGEAQRVVDEVKTRTTEAVERGRELYAEKQHEIEEQFGKIGGQFGKDFSDS